MNHYHFIFTAILIISSSCIPSSREMKSINDNQLSMEEKIDSVSRDLQELKRINEIQNTEIQRLKKSNSNLSSRLDKLDNVKSTTLALKNRTPDNVFTIAEAYYNDKNYIDAILAYQTFIDSFPRNKKVPVCYLKQGLSLINIGRKSAAIYFFETLIDKYPDTNEAILAQQKMQEIR